MKKKTQTIQRTGFGFDSHGFGSSGTLILGGVKFEGEPALQGHSDGDALFHAVIDALLGAASLGDIGEMFPDTSSKLKGIDSGKLLSKAMGRLKKVGWRAVHADITVVANRPRLSPHKAGLKKRLSAALNLPSSDVNIKGKTQEALTWFGPKGGIAVWAVATIERG